MGKLRIGVLRGGPSSEYDVSLRSGHAVLHHLNGDRYDVQDIFISKQGVWHVRGSERLPVDALSQLDLAFLALHGEYGEDGQVQRVLDAVGIPYTGSRAYESALAMNKVRAKEIARELGMKTPNYRILDVGLNMKQELTDAVRLLHYPLIVKPVRGGSSVGVTLAINDEMLSEGVRKAFIYCHQVLLEEYIEGREATCGVVESFRGKTQYSLLPVEIIPKNEARFFDYDAKYGGTTIERCPSSFSHAVSNEVQDMAARIHAHMQLRHYSRTDCIVSPKGIYFLEVNTLPGLTEQSLLPKALTAVGSSLSEFLDHIIDLARTRTYSVQ